MLDLTHFLASSQFPHTAELAVGAGNRIAITYRAADSARAQAAILEAVGAGLTALGLDPLVTLKAAAGQTPKGESLAAFEAALSALDTEGENAFTALMQKAEGASIADVVGSFEAVIGGKREAFDAEVTADTCAALPGDVKRTIIKLAASAALPVEKLDFLAGAPTSLPAARRGGKTSEAR